MLPDIQQDINGHKLSVEFCRIPRNESRWGGGGGGGGGGSSGRDRGRPRDNGRDNRSGRRRSRSPRDRRGSSPRDRGSRDYDRYRDDYRGHNRSPASGAPPGPLGGISLDLKATGNILPLTGQMVDPMDLLPPEDVVDMVLPLLVEVMVGTGVLPVVHAPLELVYLSLLILYLHKVHQQREAMVVPDLIQEAPLAPLEVGLEWAHPLEKDMEVVPRLLEHLLPEEIWDMDVEAPHRIWVDRPLLIKETALGIIGVRPPAVVS